MFPIKRGNTRMVPAKDFLAEMESTKGEVKEKSSVMRQLQVLLAKLSPSQLEEALNMVSDKMDSTPPVEEAKQPAKEGENNGEEEMSEGQEAIEDKPTED